MCILACVHLHMCVCMCADACCACVHVCLCMCMCARACVYARGCVYACVHVCVHACVLFIYIYHLCFLDYAFHIHLLPLLIVSFFNQFMSLQTLLLYSKPFK